MPAYDDLLSAEQTRREIVDAGTDLWATTPGQASQLLATWNAFALQTLGDHLIDADYEADPGTVGYLPRVTYEQAARFLGEVEQWSGLARRAAADPNFDLSSATVLPAALPRWVEVEPCPEPHLRAMIAAAHAMRDRVEAARADFGHCHLPKDREAAASKISGLVADADAAVSHGENLWTLRCASRGRSRPEMYRTTDRFRRSGRLQPFTLMPRSGPARVSRWCLRRQAKRPR